MGFSSLQILWRINSCLVCVRMCACVLRNLKVAWFCTFLHFSACICGLHAHEPVTGHCRLGTFFVHVPCQHGDNWWQGLGTSPKETHDAVKKWSKCSRCFKCSQFGLFQRRQTWAHHMQMWKRIRLSKAIITTSLTQHLRSRAFNPNLKLTVLPLFSRPLRKPGLRAVWECRSTSRWFVTLMCPCLSWWWRRPKTGQSPGEIVGTPFFEIVKIRGVLE